MCIKRIRKYFDKINEKDKIQSKEMENDIELSKDIKEAYLQGGKAVGDIVKKKTQKK